MTEPTSEQVEQMAVRIRRAIAERVEKTNALTFEQWCAAGEFVLSLLASERERARGRALEDAAKLVENATLTISGGASKAEQTATMWALVDAQKVLAAAIRARKGTL